MYKANNVCVIDAVGELREFAAMTKMDLYKSLGASVARRRRELKLTQAQVAAGIGLTRASLANIETGRQKVLLHQVYRLMNVLELESILDLAPANFSPASEGGECLPFNVAVTASEKEQLENMVRLAVASGPPKRKRAS